MTRDRYRETTADQVRTGDTITVPWGTKLTLTVDYPSRGTFTSPEGWTAPVIRFTGTDSTGKHVVEGWPQKPGGPVYVVMDAPLKGDVPGSGVFGALGDDEPDAVDFDQFDIDSWELL